jgi:hypothetical protein
MPGPDPQSLWIGDTPEDRCSVFFQRYFCTGQAGNRAKRALSIARRLRAQTWRCLWCRDDLPAWRRADARYCSEGCRKRAAHQRRLCRG